MTQLSMQPGSNDLHAPHHLQLCPAQEAQCKDWPNNTVTNEKGKKRKRNAKGETRNVRKDGGDRSR